MAVTKFCSRHSVKKRKEPSPGKNQKNISRGLKMAKKERKQNIESFALQGHCVSAEGIITAMTEKVL
jgi:hypothetical protein